MAYCFSFVSESLSLSLGCAGGVQPHDFLGPQPPPGARRENSTQTTTNASKMPMELSMRTSYTPRSRPVSRR